MENSDKSELEKLRIKYEIKRLEYCLPSFKEMAEDFEIEKVAEKETDFVIREIRRTIFEKISAYMHLFETIINPTSGSLLIFSVLKNIDEDTKKEIKDIYKKLAKLQIESMKLDTIYDEKSEAEFILLIKKEWESMRNQIFKMFERFNQDFDFNNESISKGYFG